MATVTLTIERSWVVGGTLTNADSLPTVSILHNSATTTGSYTAVPGSIAGLYQYVINDAVVGNTYVVTTVVTYLGVPYTFVESKVPLAVSISSENGLCTREDIEQIFSPSVIVKWAIMSGVVSTSAAGIAEVTNRVNWAIGLASAEFRNAMRQGGYILTGTNNGLVPIDTVSDCLIWQTNVVAVQAGLLLYVHLRPTQRGEDGRPTPDRYDGLFTWAEQQINFVRARKLKLDAQMFGSGTNCPFVTHSPSRGAYASGLGIYGPPSFSE